jgi:hypothetical protein
MFEEIARNKRLLEPVQALIAKLEPAYAQLAKADASFALNMQHPARVLLQEIAHQSLAFESVHSSGFLAFQENLAEAITSLIKGKAQSAASFELALDSLRNKWQRAAAKGVSAREDVVEVLQHAEQRHVLARKIARDIISHRDAASVPFEVVEFLCNPWAQVVAQARMSAGSGSNNADKYQALISALLWSVHPDLARADVAKLSRLVPLLLATLREGLNTINYPVRSIAEFLEVLMDLHQKAFKAGDMGHSGHDNLQPEPGINTDEAQLSSALQSLGTEPWVTPEEAEASNFVNLQDLVASGTPLVHSGESESHTPAGDSSQSPGANYTFPDDLPLGSWMELLVDGKWVRTQLTWASPHGTLYLFTSATGASHSMTRRSRDRLVSAGNLRMVFGTPAADGALVAMVQAAMSKPGIKSLE